jgi:hypothetical protein
MLDGEGPEETTGTLYSVCQRVRSVCSVCSVCSVGIPLE